MPKFSIIIPTHNRAALLPRAIDSVLAQSFTDWELHVIDDGSTDDTKAVVTSFDDPRIHYHHQENKQLNGARNAGVRAATAPWLGFLDDDDHFLPEHLERLHSAMLADGENQLIYRSGELLKGPDKTDKGHNYRNEADILPQFWQHPTGLFGMVINTFLLRQNPFNEALLLLDDFLWLVPILREYPLHQVDAYTAVVNLHPEQRSATYLDEKRLHENIGRLAQAYHLPGIAERVPYAAYQEQVLHQYMHFCRQLIRKGKRIQALKVWRQGLKYAEGKDYGDVGKTLVKVFLPGSPAL